MEPKINFSRETEKIIEKIRQEGKRPSLLLHSCCAPCSSYVMEYLREYFDLTVFFYNPNISDEEEFQRRKKEEIRLIEAFNRQVQEQNFSGMHSTSGAGMIRIVSPPREVPMFFEAIRGLEHCREGGERCFACYRLRLKRTAEEAKKGGYDYFTSTLTISPLKNAAKLNAIGGELEEELDIRFLPSDFKKKNGYKRSVELSGIYDLYRQDYCGCEFSRKEREQNQKKHEEEESCRNLSAD